MGQRWEVVGKDEVKGYGPETAQLAQSLCEAIGVKDPTARLTCDSSFPCAFLFQCFLFIYLKELQIEE